MSTYPYVDPSNELLIRDGLDDRVVREMERTLGLGALSDGTQPVTMNTDALIRLVQKAARAEVIRIEKELQEKSHRDDWGVPCVYVKGFLARLEDGS